MPTRLLSFGRLRIAADTRFDYLDRRNDRPGNLQRNWMRTWTRGLVLRDNGSFYHPRLLRFDLEGRLAFTSFDRDQGASPVSLNQDFTLDTYRAAGYVLQENPLNFYLSSERMRTRRRAPSLIDQDYTQTINTLKLTWRRRHWPVNIQGQWGRFDTEGDFPLTEKRLDIGAEVSNVTPHTATRATYGYSRFETTLSNLRIFTRRVDVSHTYHSDGDFRWSNVFDWASHSLREDLETLRATMGLEKGLVAGFRGRLEGRYRGIERAGQSDDRWESTVELEHQLYESLSSYGRFIFHREDLEEGRIERVEQDAGLDYRKRVFFGTLEYRLDFERVRQTSSLGTTLRQVVDLPLRFPAEDFLLLPDLDVDATSIAVTDSLGQVLFEEGVDYQVVPRGRQVTVVREPAGRIGAGSLVLLSYTFQREESGRGGYRRLAHRVGLRLPLLLRPFFATSRTRPIATGGNVTTGTSSGSYDAGGVSMQYGAVRADWSREDQRQDGTRTQRELGILGLRARWGRRLELWLTGTRGWTKFNDDPRFHFWRLESSLRYALRSGWEGRLQGAWARQEVDLGNRRSWELRTALAKRMGRTRLKLEWSVTSSRSPVVGDHEDQRVSLEFTRVIR